MTKFNKYDKQIVKLLQKNGRLSAIEIAKEIGGVSRRQVAYRMDKLVQDGVIDICAVVNPRAIGFTTYADVFIEVESDNILDVAKKIATYEMVNYVACSMGGDDDISIQVLAKDAGEVYKFVTEVIRKLPGVVRTVTSIVPIVLQDAYKWQIPQDLFEEE